MDQRFSTPALSSDSAAEQRRPTAVETTAAIRDGARLAALRDLDLLDSDSDETIDSIARLATKFLGVPVSLVSLVDADRQFFTSQQGLPADWAEARQAPLSHSFCQ